MNVKPTVGQQVTVVRGDGKEWPGVVTKVARRYFTVEYRIEVKRFPNVDEFSTVTTNHESAGQRTPADWLARAWGFIAVSVMIASVVVANALTSKFGFVPVGFGQQSTAGTYAAGFALAARDAIQDTWGKRAMLTTLAFASVASFAVSDPHIAAASAGAFLAAELIDFIVYSPLRERGRFGGQWWAAAVAASGAVGSVVDTALFIGIAFGVSAILPAMAGQLIGKAYASALYIIGGKVVCGAVLCQPHRVSGGA